MDDFRKKILKLVKNLSKIETGTKAYNQYNFRASENEIRRKNLELYLTEMHRYAPKILLLGEAPGHKGARLSGVPFTSEQQLLNGVSQEIDLFGKKKGYKKTKEFEKEQTEQSATIVWNGIVESGQIPLLWNTYPFHPHKPGSGRTNRTPRVNEVDAGEKFLHEIIDLFKIKKIVAVGRVAESKCKKLNMACVYLRHPSHGGQKYFRSGLLALLKK